MDIWYMTLNCAMDYLSILVLVVSGYCLWKLNKQTTQKSLPDYQREGTCDMYGFQADVVEVNEDRLLINNVLMLMNHISSETDGGDLPSPLKPERIWFPFSYPTMNTKNPVELILSLKQQEENSPVAKKGDKIWFVAMIQPDAEETQKVGLPEFHLKQAGLLQQISDFEWSEVSYEQLKESWYLAEQAVCRACPFITSCKGREKPCIIMMKGNGGWNRTLVQKQHPELIEDMLTDMPNKLTAGSKCHLGMKIEWLTGKDADEQGVNNKGAVVIYTLQGSVIPAGSRICSIDGKKITDLNCITEILKKHKAGDVVSITVKCNRKRLQREITLLDDKQVKKLLLDKNPFISRYSYRWWY